MDYIFVVLSSQFFNLVMFRYIVALVFVCVSEIKTSSVRRMPNCSPTLAISGAPVDHDTQICHLNPTLIIICIKIFHELCILPIPDPEVNYYPCSFPRCELVCSKEERNSANYKKISFYNHVFKISKF